MSTTPNEEKRYRFEQLMHHSNQSVARKREDKTKYHSQDTQNMWVCFQEGFNLGTKLVPEMVAEKLAGK
jgi:hypothetical protein